MLDILLARHVIPPEGVDILEFKTGDCGQASFQAATILSVFAVGSRGVATVWPGPYQTSV